MVLGEQDVGECGGGLGVVGVGGEGEVAAVGVLGGREVRRSFGNLGGEKNIFGLLRSEGQGGEQFGGGGGWVGLGRALAG